MPNFETKEELYKFYDEAMKEVAQSNDITENATTWIKQIFLSGVTYTDKNGQKQVSPVIAPGTYDKANQTQIFEAIFNKGHKIIKECDRPGSGGSLMMWFAKYKGITAAELTELGKNPESQTSLATIQKLEGMKQEYADLINSEDPEKLSEFYMGVFKAFKKESKLLLNSGNVNTFVKNWPKLSQWTGVTGTIQQSFKFEGQPMTEKQSLLTNKLNEKIKKAFGNDMELRDMISLMQSVQGAAVSMYAACHSLEDYNSYLQLKGDAKLAEREKFADAVRIFNIAQNIALSNSGNGQPTKFFTKEMGKAMTLASLGYGESVSDNDDLVDHMQPRSDIWLGQMKYLAGDDAYFPVCNFSQISNYEYPNPDDQLNTILSEQIVQNCTDKTKFNEILNKEETIDEIVAVKNKAHERLTNEEITCYFSDVNPKYTKEMKEMTRSFFRFDPEFRFNKIPEDLKFVLNSYCENEFGYSAEEYVAGARPMKGLCAKAYKAQIKKIAAHKSTDTVDVAYHKDSYNRLKVQLASVGSTIASSKEFVEMEKALKALESADPNYPIGREEEYKAKLEALKKASETYINAKKADGKTERSTGRGQKRFTLAKRLQAFASESLAQIEKAEEAYMLANIPDKRATSFDITDLSKHVDVDFTEKLKPITVHDFNTRMDDMLAPHAKGSPELIKWGIFKTKSTDTTSLNLYVPDDIEMPENCPFTDHEFAIMSYAEIANTENFKEGFRYDKNLSNEANALKAYTFSHDDIFMYFRSNTPNDVPLFNNARHSAENNLKEYMKGNPVPMAKSLKNNIDITLRQIRSMDTVDRQMQTHLLAARQSLDLLRKDPSLIQASGISGKDIKEIVAREAQMKFLDDKILAEEALKNPGNMSPEEIEDCYAKIIASNVIAAAEVREIANSSTSPESVQITQNFSRLVRETGYLKSEIDNAKKGEIQLDDEQLKQKTNEFKALNEQKEKFFSMMDNFSAYRKTSAILERFSDPKMFETNCKALMTIIKKNPHFAEIKANPGLLTDSDTVKPFLASADRNMKSIVDKFELNMGEKAETELTNAPKEPVLKNPEINAPVKSDSNIVINI